MFQAMRNISLSAKFVPPLIGGAVVAMTAGALLIIQEVQQANAVQRQIAETALTTEQETAEAALLQALTSKADILGRFMAKTSVDLILSYDFPSLTAFQEEAAKDADVAYTAFLKPDGTPMTAFERPADPGGILERRYPIAYDGDELGSVLIGMSRASVEAGMAEGRERIEKAVAAVDASAAQALRRFYVIIGADMLAIGAVVAFTLIFLFRRLVVRPLDETRALLSDLAQGRGDLTVQLPVESGDEIGRLREVINAFVTNLRGMIRSVSREVDTLTGQADALREAAAELSSSSDEERSQTEQVATAMNQMVATVQEVARHVEETAAAADAGREQAERGRAVVQETVQRIRQLSAEVENAAGVIARLQEGSEKIGVVLDVINGIAEQTNLLALNAAIEAARAGEQGRGFAVVADEVRTLASRTHESTLEIRDMIGQVQEATGDAVTAMERGQGAARESVDQAENAGESLDAILEMVRRINDMTTQIASAAHEQTLTSEEINRNVETISGLSVRTAEGASHTNTACQEVSQAAGRLQELVGQFRV